MKKAVVRQTGGPEVLQLIEVPYPVPGEGEVLVDLKATGLNWSELMIRRGEWPIEISENGFTPGSEGAGVVEKTGPGVTDMQPGERVIVFDFNAYLDEGQGCYAEKIVVPRDKILKYPENLDFAEAAAVPMAAVTAYDALINHSPLPESGTVVITACHRGGGNRRDSTRQTQGTQGYRNHPARKPEGAYSFPRSRGCCGARSLPAEGGDRESRPG